MKDNVKLRILQTSDLHGYVYPYNYSTRQEENVGIAKLSTVMKKYRDENTILIDTGDTIQGSPLTYYQAKENMHEINPMANIFNYLKYDYFTLGNHEFNYGMDYLCHFLHNLKPMILNSNLLDIKTNQPFIGKPYHIMEIPNWPKVAIIGATTHYIPNWEQPAHIENLDIKDAFETTKKYVDEIKDVVDFIIVNYHGGFERDFITCELDTADTGENQGFKMLQEIPEIDLLLTGHQHRSLSGNLFGTHYTQPGYNARQVAKIDINFEYINNEWLPFISNELIDIENNIADQDILDLIRNVEEKTQSFLDTPVGTMDKDLLIPNQLEARLNKHPLVSLINQIQLEYINADIAMCSLANQVSGFKKVITIRDVIGTYVYPNTLVVKKMSGKILKQALEKTAEFFTIKENKIVISDDYNHPKLQLYAYDMYENIEYTMKISNPIGNRITNLTFKGKQVKEDDVFSVIMNNYRASGGGDYFFIKDCEVIKDTQIEIIELIINYILKNKHITIHHQNNIKITL